MEGLGEDNIRDDRRRRSLESLRDRVRSRSARRRALDRTNICFRWKPASRSPNKWSWYDDDLSEMSYLNSPSDAPGRLAKTLTRQSKVSSPKSDHRHSWGGNSLPRNFPRLSGDNQSAWSGNEGSDSGSEYGGSQSFAEEHEQPAKTRGRKSWRQQAVRGHVQSFSASSPVSARKGSGATKPSPLSLSSLSPGSPTLLQCPDRSSSPLPSPSVDSPGQGHRSLSPSPIHRQRSSSPLTSPLSDVFLTSPLEEEEEQNYDIKRSPTPERRSSDMSGHFPHDVTRPPLPFLDEGKLETIYRAVLRSILSPVGPSQEDGRALKTWSLLNYVREAFRIPKVKDREWVNKENKLACKESLLVVEVVEGRDLKAMDANGFSDPYALLSIERQTGATEGEKPKKSKKAKDTKKRTISTSPDDDDFEKPLYNQFQISQVIDKSLQPKWNETFEFPIDCADTDVLQVFIMDKDADDTALKSLRHVHFSLSSLKQGIRHALKTGDDFMGRVTIPLASLPHTGSDWWWPLRQEQTEQMTQGEIRLRTTFRLVQPPDDPPDVDRVQLVQLIRKALLYHEAELAELQTPYQEVGDGDEEDEHLQKKKWDGHLSQKAEYIIDQCALQRGLSAAETAFVNWVVVQEQHLTGKMSVVGLVESLKQLNIAVPKTDILGPNKEQRLAESLNMFISHILENLKDLKEVFPPSQDRVPNELVHTISSIKLVYSMAVWRRFHPHRHRPCKDVEKSIVQRLIVWYSGMSVLEGVQGQALDSLATQVEQMSALLEQIEGMSEKKNKHYSDLFACIHLDYASFTLKHIIALCCQDIQTLLAAVLKQLTSQANTESKAAQRASTALYQLFRSVVKLEKQVSKLKLSPDETVLISEYHKWFSPIVPHWLHAWACGMSTQVANAVRLDPMDKPNSADVNFSFSAIDVLTIFARARSEWELLYAWPDPVCHFTIWVKVTDMITQSALQYGMDIHKRLLEKLKRSDKLVIDDKLCIAINNIEHISYNGLHKLPEKLNFEKVIVSLSNRVEDTGEVCSRAFASTLTRMVYSTEHHMENCMAPASRYISQHLCTKAQQVLRDFPEKKDMSQCLHVVFQSFDHTLNQLREKLRPSAYKRILLKLWNTVLQMIRGLVSQQRPHSDPTQFFRAYLECLTSQDGFYGYFSSSSVGCDRHLLKELENRQYKNLQQFITQNCEEIDDIMANYFAELARQDEELEDLSLGSLTLQASFLSDAAAGNTELLRINLMSHKEIFWPVSDGQCQVYITAQVCPALIQLQSVGTIKSQPQSEPTALLDEQFDIRIPSSCARGRGTCLRLCMFAKHKMSQDLLLGHTLILLNKLQSCTTAAYPKVKAMTRSLCLRSEMITSSALEVIDLRAKYDPRAGRFVESERGLVQQATRTTVKLQQRRNLGGKVRKELK